MKKRNILTWHIHGSYLYYLSQIKSDFFIPAGGNEIGYKKLPMGFSWGNNVHQVAKDEIKNLNLDIIIFQSNWPSYKIYLKDQYKFLSESQRNLPKIYLEHDPPRKHATDTKHIVKNADIHIVHVTEFNKLMWDNDGIPSSVIEHGVLIPKNIFYRGNKAKGLVNVNNISQRGRRLGFDIYQQIKKIIPLDLIGINSEKIGGFGSLNMDQVPSFISQYRFYFNPIRYTSLGLSVIEAMMVGLPILGLATTELVTIIRNGVNGFLETDPIKLIPHMKRLIRDHKYAKMLGQNARNYAKKRFSINRFIKDWDSLIDKLLF